MAVLKNGNMSLTDGTTTIIVDVLSTSINGLFIQALASIEFSYGLNVLQFPVTDIDGADWVLTSNGNGGFTIAPNV